MVSGDAEMVMAADGSGSSLLPPQATMENNENNVQNKKKVLFILLKCKDHFSPKSREKWS